MKKFLILIFMVALSFKSYSIELSPDLYKSDLGNSCEFISNSKVIEKMNSYIKAIETVKATKDRCSSILNNSKAYLSSIQKEMTARGLEQAQIKSNKDIVNSEILRRVNLGTYTNELDSTILDLSLREHEINSKDYQRKSHLNNALTLGATVFDDLATAPECVGNVANSIVRPTAMVLSQVSGYLLPGSDHVVSGIATGMGKLIGSFTSFLDKKFSKVEKEYKEMITNRDYYVLYKCAYKNLNSLSCDLREHKTSKTQRLSIIKELKSLDLEDKPFFNLHLIETHYPRIQSILTQIRDIYETSKQAETKVQIQRIESELFNIRNKIPRLTDIDLNLGWRDDVEGRQTEWQLWSRSFRWLDRLSPILDSKCRVLLQAGELEGLGVDDSCEPEKIFDKASRDRFIEKVLIPSVEQMRADKENLGLKLEKDQNTEKLYRELREQQISKYKNNLNISDYPLDKLLTILQENLRFNSDKPVSRFAIRIKSVVFALKILLKFREDFDGLSIVAPNSFVQVSSDKSCKILDEEGNHNCKTFDDLSKVIYKYLANKLSDGDILTVENINGTFTNYIDGVKSYYLNSLDTDTALKYSRYQTMYGIYLVLKKESTIPDSVGMSDLTLMSRVTKSFEKLFGKEISKKLVEDSEDALYGNSDYDREAIHACAIFYPMLVNSKYKKFGIKTKQGKARDICHKLLQKRGGVKYLKNLEAKFPLITDKINYKKQCYYRDYQREALIQRVKQIRDAEDEFSGY